MNKLTKQIIAGAAVIFIAAIVYWWGGDAPGLRGWDTNPANTVSETAVTQQSELKETASPTSAAECRSEGRKEKSKAFSEESTVSAKKETQKQTQAPPKDTNAVTEDFNQNTEPSSALVPSDVASVISDEELTCTLCVRCDTIMDNMQWLEQEKLEIIPLDGILLPQQTVTFYEGESVFNLLLREMKKNKIHFEFVNIPVYNSAYIEGINNIYEFDCGELSGWMYKVNGWFPNYGCSQYQLKNGDKVEWVYTCNSGEDVGGKYSSRNGM